MSITCLDTAKYNEASSLIAVCKSDSQQHGAILRAAHYKLGSLIAEQIARNLPNQQITVVIMMRAGLCFGMGIADGLEYASIETPVLFHYNNEQWKKETSNCPHALNNTMLLVDAVINTGESIIMFSDQLTQSRQIIFAANVISKKGLKNFEDKEVYAVRISENSFVGSKNAVARDGKGPDTGDRLFNTR
ncbi:MAG: uracil phosphoribosyltransferase [Treponema sp.]|jgi:uracil phosphoribosyltransferase|nr:uracil phosphoribosyltransferase [Treponema sp.]